MIRIVLADDHALVRKGIRALLALVADMSVVGEAKDGTEAVRVVVDARPDVLLLDMRMPGGDGLWVVRELRRRELLPSTLILSTFEDDAAALDVVRAGARGFLLKDVTLDRLVDTVRTLAAGGTMIRPRMTAHAESELATRGAQVPRSATASSPTSPSASSRCSVSSQAASRTARSLGLSSFPKAPSRTTCRTS